MMRARHQVIVAGCVVAAAITALLLALQNAFGGA
jgi:hypothetical protein